jgi:hypothetical protein
LGASRASSRSTGFKSLKHGHASASTLGRDDYTAHRVEMSKLDLLLADARMPAPTLVKLTVEGSELAVPQGARRRLNAKAPPAWGIGVDYETSSLVGYQLTSLLDELARRHLHRLSHSARR